MTLGDCLINSVLIIGSVPPVNRSIGVTDLVEQCTSQSGVIDIFVRQAPIATISPLPASMSAICNLRQGPPTRRAVLFNQPFTGAAGVFSPVLSTRR